MKLLYSNEVLLKRIEELGEQISKDYAGKDVLLVGVLKGCTVFMSHLLVNIKGTTEIDFMTISSYKHGTKSNDFKFVQDLDADVKGRDVLIVEDIIDSGKTLAFTQKHLEALGAKSVETVVLVNKTTNLKHEIKKPKYIGFTYENAPFIIGFGFDYGGHYRNLPDVFQMEDKDF